jgi:hypothetical protein
MEKRTAQQMRDVAMNTPPKETYKILGLTLERSEEIQTKMRAITDANMAMDEQGIVADLGGNLTAMVEMAKDMPYNEALFVGLFIEQTMDETVNLYRMKMSGDLDKGSKIVK